MIGRPEIPRLGLGTWPLEGPACTDIVAEAVAMGYRHIDTAQMYGNERAVGEGLSAAGAPDDLFLVTKIHQDRFADGTVMASAAESVERLGRPVSLILCHWPPQGLAPERVAEALFAVQEAGLATAIGVSNFTIAQMTAAAAVAPVVANQVEYHLLLDQSRLHAAAEALGIQLTAYMPLARGKALSVPAVQEIAAARGLTPAQVALRWIVERGVAAIPMSSKPANLRDNLAVLEARLSEAEIAALSEATGAGLRLCRPSGWEPDWDV